MPIPHDRRAVLKKLAAATLAPAFSGLALADTYPSRPINLVVPFAAGGMTDILGRQLGKRITTSWGTPAIVDNRLGAGGIIGADRVAKAPADGYNLLITTTAHVVNPAITKKLPYDTLGDFTPIAMLARTPNVLLVHPGIPANNLQELLTYARKKGGVTYGSSGTGGTTHLSGELLASKANAPFIHVPYKGTALAINDLIGKQIDASFVDALSAVKYVESGTLRAIAVSTRDRNPALPQVPTIAEQGVPGYETEIWIGLYGPAKLPAQLVEKLNKIALESMAEADFKNMMAKQGTQNGTMDVNAFQAYVPSEMAKWADICKLANIQPA